MDLIQKQTIEKLRQAGLGFTDIANLTTLTTSTVRSYLTRKQIEPIIMEATDGYCLVCKKELSRSNQKTCSHKCRYKLWQLNKIKNLNTLPKCPHCGRYYLSLRQQTYCSHACYIASRFKKGA